MSLRWDTEEQRRESSLNGQEEKQQSNSVASLSEDLPLQCCFPQQRTLKSIQAAENIWNGRGEARELLGVWLFEVHSFQSPFNAIGLVSSTEVIEERVIWLFSIPSSTTIELLLWPKQSNCHGDVSDPYELSHTYCL